MIVEQSKKSRDQYYYSESEWARLGCGPLPDHRNRDKEKEFTAKQKSDILARGNPAIDGKNIKGYN
jgi:hypothetical protein